MAEEMREAAGEDEQVGEGGDPYRVVDPHWLRIRIRIQHLS
jgi:hypothetical protein